MCLNWIYDRFPGFPLTEVRLAGLRFARSNGTGQLLGISLVRYASKRTLSKRITRGIMLREG